MQIDRYGACSDGPPPNLAQDSKCKRPARTSHRFRNQGPAPAARFIPQGDRTMRRKPRPRSRQTHSDHDQSKRVFTLIYALLALGNRAADRAKSNRVQRPFVLNGSELTSEILLDKLGDWPERKKQLMAMYGIEPNRSRRSEDTSQTEPTGSSVGKHTRLRAEKRPARLH